MNICCPLQLQMSISWFMDTCKFFKSNCLSNVKHIGDSTNSPNHDVHVNVVDHSSAHIEMQFLSIDDMLKTWVGEFGKAQILHFTLTSFTWALEAMHTLVIVFADRTPQWRCVIDASNTVNYNLVHQNVSHSTSTCNQLSQLCAMDHGVWEWVNKAESTVSQWNLICENNYKQGLMQSAFFIGMLLGAGIFGNLSDSRLGRKGALAMACMCNAICGMLTAASPNYPIYVILRFLTGVCSSGLGLTSFVLATELIGPSQRSTAAMSSLYFYPFGIILLAGLGTISSSLSWRYLYLITSTPTVLYCLFILPFLVESPRWYLVRGRSEEALGVLKAIAKKNGMVVPTGVSLSMDLEDDDNKNDKDDNKLEIKDLNNCDGAKGAKGTLMDVFRKPDTRLRMIVLVVVWFACALGYYSLNLNVGNLGTNLSISLMLNALAEIPGYAITTFLLNKVGRRITLIFAMLLCGFSCIVSAGVSFRIPHLWVDQRLRSYIQLGGDLVSLFAIAGTYNLLYLYTAELFPTVVRNAALGLTNQAGAIGSILAPLNVLSTHVHIGLPFLIIGLMAFLGGILAIKLPETMNQKFHETLEGMRRSEKEAST